jgi:general secretion pathway protein H
MRPARAAGFTLIEILVVMLILVVVIGIVAANLSIGPEDRGREEAERLVLLLRSAREEAVLQGRLYAFAASAADYRFLTLNERGRLVPVADDLLRERRLPPDVRIASLRVDGSGDAERDGVLLSPSGELPEFALVIEAGSARWTIVGRPQGDFRLQQGLYAGSD